MDDMFVIIEAWKNLSNEEMRLDVPHRMALTLSRAGVSITVTSITDMVAFGIGATTVRMDFEMHNCRFVVLIWIQFRISLYFKCKMFMFDYTDGSKRMDI